MVELNLILEDLTHHAYLIIGAAEQVVPHLHERLAKTEIVYQTLPQFGIGESRELRERQARMVGEAEQRSFILAFESITVEAQQALLKTFEEPAARTKFFIVAPTGQMFLPTLLSRLQIIRLDPEQSLVGDVVDAAKKFLAATPEARLTQVAAMLEQTETPAETRSLAINFTNAITSLIHSESGWEAKPAKQQALIDLTQARDYLHDRAASARLILEHLALVL